jgi:hypothetical protein
MLSNLIGMYWWEQAKEGNITGGGPADPKQRAAWLQNNQPYSRKTANGWVPLDFIEPMNHPIGIIADFVEISHSMNSESAMELGAAVGLAIYRNIGQNTWARMGLTLGDVAEEVGKGQVTEETMKKLRSPFVTTATGGPVGNRVTRALDPHWRETRGMVDELRQRTPGYSRTLPPDRDGLGDVPIPAKSLGSNWWGLLGNVVPKFREQAKTGDWLRDKYEELKVKAPYFGWSVDGRALASTDIRDLQPGEKPGIAIDAHQRDNRIQLYRSVLRNEIEPELKADRDFNDPNQPLALKQKIMESALQKAWQASEKMLMIQDPQLGKRVIMNQNEKGALLPAPERQDLRLDLELEVKELEAMTPEERTNMLRFDYKE